VVYAQHIKKNGNARKDLHADVAPEVKRVLEDRAVLEQPPLEFYHTCQRHSPSNVQTDNNYYYHCYYHYYYFWILFNQAILQITPN